MWLRHHFQGQKVKGQLAGVGHIVAASRTACFTSTPITATVHPCHICPVVLPPTYCHYILPCPLLYTATIAVKSLLDKFSYCTMWSCSADILYLLLSVDLMTTCVFWTSTLTPVTAPRHHGYVPLTVLVSVLPTVALQFTEHVFQFFF